MEMEKFSGINKALRDDHLLLKSEVLGSGLRRSFLETTDGAQRVKYSISMPTLLDSLIVLSLKYLAGDAGELEDVSHYDHGAEIRGAIDWWIFNGSRFHAKRQGDLIVCEAVSQYDHPRFSAYKTEFYDSFVELEKQIAREPIMHLRDILK
jgi:hypothetical protein